MKKKNKQTENRPTTKSESEQKTYEKLLREKAQLERKLYEAQIAADAYNMMIDIAERRFNINIRDIQESDKE